MISSAILYCAKCFSFQPFLGCGADTPDGAGVTGTEIRIGQTMKYSGQLFSFDRLCWTGANEQHGRK